MKHLYLLKLFVIIIVFGGCEDGELKPFIECETETEYYGQFILKYYDENPLNSGRQHTSSVDQICWNDLYPIQIGAGGNGNCGDGYEGILNPYMGLGVTLYEYDQNMPEYTSHLRGFHIQAPFACDDFSTQENFYQLLQVGEYHFASDFDDFGKFIIKFTDYSDGTSIYSSEGVDNDEFRISVDSIINIKPRFHSEPIGNNGIPASIEATLNFSCLLKNGDGKYLLIENAELRGRFYRQSPWGYYWDDWGKGWDD